MKVNAKITRYMNIQFVTPFQLKTKMDHIYDFFFLSTDHIYDIRA